MGFSAGRGAPQTAPAAQVLAWRQHLQRLDQPTRETAAELLSSIAWLAAPGGATPYLSLFARAPALEPRLLERSVADGQVLLLPGAHGQNVLAPAADLPLVLEPARHAHRQKAATLGDAGLDARKLARLEQAIVAALEDGPLTADELRARLPQALGGSLGDAGRRAGFPSLFALAVRGLLVNGEVLRHTRDGRLHREPSVFLRPAQPPPAPPPRHFALAALARRYFRALGPAPAASFAWWAEASLGEARAAAAAADLVAVPVEGEREPFLLASEQLEAFLEFQPPVPPRFAFVPFRDPYVCAARDLRGLLAAANRELVLADWRGRLVAAGGGSAVHQHFIVLGGWLAGLWEYDEQARRVRHVLFDPASTRLQRALQDQAARLAAHIAEHVGSARFYCGDRGSEYGRLDQVVAAWKRPQALDPV